MGTKEKPTWIYGPQAHTLPLAPQYATMDREQFKQIIEDAADLETPEIQAALNQFASTTDRCTWGQFFLKDEPSDEVCGCPIAQISDVVYWNAYTPISVLERHYGAVLNFVTRFDRKMRVATARTRGIVTIKD